LRQRRIPGFANIIEVDDPQEIKALAKAPAIDRVFDTSTCPLNWFILKRSLSVLSFRGRRFPTIEPRDLASRAEAQEKLWSRLNEQVNEIKAGPATLGPLADWVKGAGSDTDIGILAQQLLGRLFRDDFIATRESWAAARMLVAAPRSWNLPKLCWWFVTGKVKRAKSLLAGMVSDDLSAVNAIGIAVHNLAKSLRYMRLLYADAANRSALSAEAAAAQCLRAPVSVYRQATAPGTVMGTAFPKHALFALKIGAASQRNGGRSLIFMDDTWSSCPASTWVPALLQGIWTRATR
jgi:hypothetical protein